ncbi:MAG: hypothetical protein ACLRXB_06040 [Escherichia coli]
MLTRIDPRQIDIASSSTMPTSLLLVVFYFRAKRRVATVTQPQYRHRFCPLITLIYDADYALRRVACTTDWVASASSGSCL